MNNLLVGVLLVIFVVASTFTTEVLWISLLGWLLISFLGVMLLIAFYRSRDEFGIKKEKK